MLESPTSATSVAATTPAITATTAQHQQMARKIENGDFTEDYFASLTGPAKRLIEDVVAVKEAYEDVWTGLDVSEQEEIINENIIRPEAILRYEGHVAIRDSARHPSATTAEVRLSSFGVDKVFPRLKVKSGQKENTFEDTSGSQGEDLGSDCTYSYRDEHSGPWSWMTRSQQELSFESGPNEPCSSEELDGLETLTTASPSRALNRQSLLVRQSKGNPLYAKPVGIPTVPTLQPKLNNTDQLMKMEQNQPLPVSPHKINNFVYEEDNRIILDFGTNDDFGTNNGTSIDNALRGTGGHSPTNTSNNSESLSKSSSSLLAKMKEKKNTLKKSLSNVSNGGTLRRKKSQKILNNTSPSSTLSSSTHSSMSSLPITAKSIVKPSIAPPPPPIQQISKPVNSINTTQMTQSLYETKSESDGGNGTNGIKNVRGQPELPQQQQNGDDIVKPLEEFKIDLDTQSDIPKTGFDFLDNW